MTPHIRYEPFAFSGTYYFRPYNPAVLRFQQEAVTAWGGDPRNPYSNEIFEHIYRESDADDPSMTPSDHSLRLESDTPLIPPEPLEAPPAVR